MWYIKRLTGNDTYATGAHQAGPYITRQFLFDVFPSINDPKKKNPDAWFDLSIDSHPDIKRIRAIWYNNKLHGGTRNETRITNFGGISSPLLDPDSTGSIAVFAFHKPPGEDANECHVWVCDHETEEDLIEDKIGPVEPGRYVIWSSDQTSPLLFQPKARTSCALTEDEIPTDWISTFPTGAEIIKKTLELRPSHGIQIDARLMKRRECEFEIFKSVEEAVELPIIRDGFTTVAEFIARAQTILQRRKSRAGRSLELQAKAIFEEEGLIEGVDFDHQVESEPGTRKTPDFLFPSQKCYQDKKFPEKRLMMLAVKTTCKDRWRQILNEADRIKNKHLLTLQEGVSESQFREMTKAGVKLVVPAPIIDSYPKKVRTHIQTLESFLADVRLLGASSK